jgi:hypothetical protein
MISSPSADSPSVIVTASATAASASARETKSGSTGCPPSLLGLEICRQPNRGTSCPLGEAPAVAPAASSSATLGTSRALPSTARR